MPSRLKAAGPRLPASIFVSRRYAVRHATVMLVGLVIAATISHEGRAQTPPSEPQIAEPERLGSSFLSTAGKQAIEVRATDVSLNELARWLSANYDLPYSAQPPRLERVSPLRLYQLRHRALLSSQIVGNGTAPLPGYLREVVAVYDDKDRIVYLPESWTGETVADQSVLVHEMVHHLQNLAGQKFACAGEREKPAYLAQDAWLKQHGLDLEKAFDVDMFTVVAISACMNSLALRPKQAVANFYGRSQDLTPR